MQDVKITCRNYTEFDTIKTLMINFGIDFMCSLHEKLVLAKFQGSKI
jgi:hypothetical protein